MFIKNMLNKVLGYDTARPDVTRVAASVQASRVEVEYAHNRLEAVIRGFLDENDRVTGRLKYPHGESAKR